MGPQPDPYYYDRAEAELEQAQRADHPAAVRAHYTLAGYYLDRFYGVPEGEDSPLAIHTEEGAAEPRGYANARKHS